MKIQASTGALRVLDAGTVAPFAVRRFLLLFAFFRAKCHPLRLALFPLFLDKLGTRMAGARLAGTSGYENETPKVACRFYERNA